MSTEKTVTVTVLLPCYNAENYISSSVKSILTQTYRSLELYIIDDASSDKTIDLISQMDDDRIRLIKKERNTGYTDSLNMGLKLANGKYIARMDADDISHPERLAKQVAYMEANPECVVCGTTIRLIPSQSPFTYPVVHNRILEELFFTNPFAHPSIMMRKSVIDQYQLQYDKSYEPTEDYELWSRVLQLGQLHNLNDVLLDYRTHDNQISAYKRTLQRNNKYRVRMNMFRRIDPELMDTDTFLDTDYLKNISDGDSIIIELRRRFELLKQLSELNSKRGIYAEDVFLNVQHRLKKEWIHAITATKGKYGLRFYRELCSAIPDSFTRLGIKQHLAFYVRSVRHSF